MDEGQPSGPYEALLSLAVGRRTVRAFDPARPVTDQQIEQMIEVARWAPSGGNSQPWHFVVTRDLEDREFNATIYEEQLHDKRAMEQAVRGTMMRVGASFHRAPVHILVLGDTRVRTAYPIRTMLDKEQRHLYSGLSNATLLLMLAASSIGLGARYVSDANSPFMSTMLRAHYGIPDFFEVYELVPVGWPSRETRATPRRPLDAMLHRGRFEPDKLLSDDELHDFLGRETRLGSYGAKQRSRPESGSRSEGGS